ncbi:winged helix-turn-helix domain-containing protein [Agaribacter flavus]|uniref:Transcriptional regulator n=1 Tax=Agaribacter flavus TaxID=1902781 RepID=A0ABV7FTV0_9ALTE
MNNSHLIILNERVLNTLTGEVFLDLKRRELLARIENTPLNLLLFMMQQPQQVITKQVLFDEIWKGKFVTEEVLTVAVSHLRKALGDSPKQPQIIKTIPGQGYQFIGKTQKLSPQTIVFFGKKSDHSFHSISGGSYYCTGVSDESATISTHFF